MDAFLRSLVDTWPKRIAAIILVLLAACALGMYGAVMYTGFGAEIESVR